MGWTPKTNLRGPQGPVGGVAQEILDTGIDLNTLTSAGTYAVTLAPTDWMAQHYPVNSRGTIRVYKISVYTIQSFRPIDSTRNIYERMRTSAGVWDTTWADIGAVAKNQEQDGRLALLEAASSPTGTAQSASGLKTVPLSLTIGLGIDGNAGASMAIRVPMKWNAPIFRARVHIRNISSNSGNLRAGAVNFTGLWWGKHAGAGQFTAAPTQIQGAFSTNAGGDEYVSKWFNLYNTPGVEDLLSFGYTAVAGTNVASQGGQNWQNANPATASQTAPAVTEATVCPFFIWLEAETYAGTPVVAVLGDSLSCGMGDGSVSGASNKIRVDSWLSQYCMGIKALPVHYANSGDSFASWQNLSHRKWSFFNGTAKPDALVVAMGSNDLFGGDSLAAYQARFSTVVEFAKKAITPAIYLANIMPRNTHNNTTHEQIRRTVNTWYLTLPNGSRDVFDFSASISTDDENITTAYDSDGTHLTASGYLKNAQAIIRPVTTKPVTYAS